MSDRFSLFMDLAINRRKAAARGAPPADCIRQFPTLNPETVELVGFDSRSVPRIRVEVPRDEDVEEWSAWLLRWLRRRERRLLKGSMRVLS